MTHFTRQPETLPETLPAGIKLQGCTATDPMRLVNGRYYVNGDTYFYGWAPSQVLWESVPLPDPPEPVEAPKLCECCGVRKADSTGSDGFHTRSYSRACWLETDTGDYARNVETFFAKIRARHSQLTAIAAERPIQAGDWVECVDASLPASGSVSLIRGNRYCVDAAKYGSLYIGGWGWKPERFKRVDGPHPVTGGEDEDSEERVCASCAEGDPRLGEQRCKPVGGKWYCLDTCFPEALERHKENPLGTVGTGNAQSSVSGETRCSECKAPAVLRGGVCGYCSNRLGVNDAYADMNNRCVANTLARHRMTAMDRAERPRVTAESRMLAGGHPVNWPSTGNDEP